MSIAERLHARERPLFPLRSTLVYPSMVGPFSAARPASMTAIESALATEDKLIIVVAQRDASVDNPSAADLYSIGTQALIKRMARSEGTLEVILQGLERIRITRVTQSAGYLRAQFEPAPVVLEPCPEAEALQRELLGLTRQLQALGQPMTRIDMAEIARQVQDPMQLIYLLASVIGLEVEKAQTLLESPEQLQAMRLLNDYMRREHEILELRKKIAGEAESAMGREQREYVLRQQLRAIQQELGEQDPDHTEASDARRLFEQAELPDEVRREADRELKRLESIPAASPEHQVIRARLDLILELPWRRHTEDKLDLSRARQILDDDHYDLGEIKERILEQLAVLKLNPQAKAPILCFVGPPGVGKTSLGQSIARALGRNFERFSLGGLHDEAELRGHRRTYVGAMPGRIIQALRRAESNNPLLMLDEVDKLGQDFRGDPAAALLEILDPAQNHQFRDNYLDLPFDLSQVFFITTANTLDSIPTPLLDRMEVLRLSGYSDEEKLEIAQRYLLERQRAQAGLTGDQFQVPAETISQVIRGHTREAGVRELERVLGRLARKLALQVAEGRTEPAPVSPERLSDLLGAERFQSEQTRKELPPGVATGLAWTATGGDVLYVEAIERPDSGKLSLTGQLGEIMRESAQAAQSWVLSQAEQLGIEHPKPGLHLHVPAGAIPKDGPSAGITIAAAVASLYTRRPLRSDTAMTGEITLIGLVLPVGGIKEKALAARRAGIKRVILPKQNEKDLRDLPEAVPAEIELVLVERIEEALHAVMMHEPPSEDE